MKLTGSQKLIYDMEKYAGGSINIVCGSMLLNGSCEEKKICDAIQQIFRINDALRTQINEIDGVAEQKISDYEELKVEILHFSNENEMSLFAQRYAKQPLDFYGKLCEIKAIILPNSFGVIIKMHHIVGDAWTLTLIANQLNTIFNGDDPVAFSYIDYVDSEARYLSGRHYERDRRFFSEQFSSCEEVTYLKTSQVSSFNTERIVYKLPKELTNSVFYYASSNKTTPYMLLLTAFGIYFSRVKMNQGKFYIGTAILNRTGYKEKNTAGMFINTVPLLMEVNNSLSFQDNLKYTENECFAIFRHQKFNYADILSDLRNNHSFKERLYDVLFSYQNASITGNSSVKSAWYHNGMQTESLQIHVDDRDQEGTLHISYDYQTEKFTQKEIDSLHNHLLTLLKDAIENDHKKPWELDFLSSEERHKFLLNYNDTFMEYARNKFVHEMIEEKAVIMPDNLAINSEGETVTYRQLNIRANRIAHALLNDGIKEGDFVALDLRGSADMIAAMLGVMKTRAAYLPLDPENTEERTKTILRDCQSKVVIDKDYLKQHISCDETDPGITVHLSDICYGICTSGTTGIPKIVCIAHENLLYYLNNLKQIYHVKPVNMPFFTKASVDLTVTSIYLPLISGGTVYIHDGDLLQILQKITMNEDLNIIKLTPTHMQIMNSNIQPKQMDNIRYLIVGGENLTSDVAGQFLYSFGKNIEIHNEYGPTETTVGCMDFVYSLEQNEESVPIGHPVYNTCIYILDKYNNCLPENVPGELCIAGDGVGAGYLNRPELNAEKFIDNPFGRGKLYKTGDLAYWREDGNIAFIGRTDFQVKIRGLRIELSEIENAISSVDGVTQSAVIVRKDETGRQLLCAFYTEKYHTDLTVIKKAIETKLPRYMMPHSFTLLDQMPVTASGKINRNALPEIDLNQVRSEESYTAPESTLEIKLAKIMEQVLHSAPIGRDNNFFDLGGDSLKAIEFISKARGDGIYIPLQSVFDHPTIRELSSAIEKENATDYFIDSRNAELINTFLLNTGFEGSFSATGEEFGDLLLTGATGFLGAHLLERYLIDEKGTAYCFVRGFDYKDSEKRLIEILHYYFGGQYDYLIGKRIVVICADLEKDSFGLTENEYASLTEKVQIIINAAGTVKHYGSYQYFYEVNVNSVERLIEFARKAHSRFIHISTLSITGNGFNTSNEEQACLIKDVFTEHDFYVGQSLSNVYVRSKFEAERRVLNAALDGLSVGIMRVGNLTNRFSDGVFQKNYTSNAFMNRIKALLDIGVYPKNLADIQIEFTPVDYTAVAVFRLVRHYAGSPLIFHINNTKKITVQEMSSYSNELGFQLSPADETVFIERIRGSIHSLEAFINETDASGRIRISNPITVSSKITSEYLRKLDFKWPDIDGKYMQKYFEFIKSRNSKKADC